MGDAALENAMARREHIIARLNEIANEINSLIEHHGQIRDELAELDDFIRMYHHLAGTQAPAELEQKKLDAPAEGGKRIRPKNPPRELVARECVELIRDAGRSLSRHELFEMLTDRGIEIRGKDPEMVLSTMLWRSKDIIRRLPEGGYLPAGERSPQEAEFDDLLSKVNPDL